MAESHQKIGALCVGSVQRLGRFQRDLVVVRRLSRSEVLEGMVAGGHRPVECLFGQAGQRAMPGQLQDDIGMKTLIILREGTHDTFVLAGTTRRADLRIHRVGDKRMHESHGPTDGSQIDEDPCRHGGVEGSDHRCFR
jgi:hypothetical protein